MCSFAACTPPPSIPSPSRTRNIKRGDKVAVRSSADRLLSEFKAETRSYLSRVMVKFHYAYGPLKRATIDASVNREVYAFVKRSQAAHQFIDSLSFFGATEADVNFDLRLRRDHVAPRCRRRTTPTLKFVPLAGSLIE